MKPIRVAVAGARGFIGSALMAAQKQGVTWLALSRSPHQPADNIESRVCDLFDLEQTKQALAGADAAVYLVHSMQKPQDNASGTFADFDLLAADNFARAAAHAGLKKIVYVSGLMPATGAQSQHLRSRYEVEQVLAASGVPLTVLRAGIVIGPGGSSFQILSKLSQRLPVMITPSWTKTLTQPVGLRDVVSAIDWCLRSEQANGQIFELGCDERVTYNDMMARTGEVFGRRPAIIPVPFFSLTLSRLWVSLFSGQPKELVAPLIQSLKQPMLAQDRQLYQLAGIEPQSFDQALRAAAQPQPAAPSAPAASRGKAGSGKAKAAATVTVLQRLPLPAGWTAVDAAAAYLDWLGQQQPNLVTVVKPAADTYQIKAPRQKAPLLQFTRQGGLAGADRCVFNISGGILADCRDGLPGQLEFRQVPSADQVLVLIANYRPRLPLPLYRLTQYQLHRLIMQRFGAWINSIAAKPGAVKAVALAPAVVPQGLN